MAIVTLPGRNQQVTDRLPSICACCGAPATLSKEKKFVWFPKWTYLLIPIGGLPFLIVLLITRKLMIVRIPLCDRHPRPWLPVQLMAGLTLFHLLVLSWGAMILAAVVERAEGRGGFGGAVIMVAWLVIWILLTVVFFVVAMRSIRPKRITNDGIVLAGVSADFAGAIGGFTASSLSGLSARGGPTRTVERYAAAKPEEADANERELCYLCGKRLQAGELASRVCRDCRA